ncbi:MAG: UPF0175 family protein [Nanoarchaeota archaeon]
MAEVITARLTDEIDADLGLIAKTEKLDRSTVLRRLLSESIANWRIDRAVKGYQEGRISAEQAAGLARLSLWGFFDMLKTRKIPVSYDAEELERDLRTISWKKR